MNRRQRYEDTMRLPAAALARGEFLTWQVPDNRRCKRAGLALDYARLLYQRMSQIRRLVVRRERMPW